MVARWYRHLGNLKMKKLLVAALAAMASTAAFAQADERFNPLEVAGNGPVSGPVMAAPQAVLFDQGPLTNGVDAGTPISILNGAAPFNYTTLGFTGAAAIRLADDFTVPAGQTWNLEAITIFGYQTNATTASINGATLRILNGAPPAGTVVFGDQTTNIVPTTTLSGAFRVSNTTLTSRIRAIQAVRIPVTVSLPAGTYFIDFTAAGTVASGPFFPPVVPNIANPGPTGNALQFAGTPAAWNPVRMGLTSDPVGAPPTGPEQGLPFIVEGTIAGPAATPPQFGFTPAPGSTVTATGGTTVGSTGNLSIAPAVATPGTGTGTPATTTLTCTAPTAPFAGFGQTITAVGTGAITGGPLAGTCTLGAAAATQTLTCTENRGGTPTTRTWTLSCPAGTAPPAPTVAVNATSTWSLIALMLGLFGFAAVMVRRQG